MCQKFVAVGVHGRKDFYGVPFGIVAGDIVPLIARSGRAPVQKFLTCGRCRDEFGTHPRRFAFHGINAPRVASPLGGA